MVGDAIGREQGRGYHQLTLFIILAYIVNTINLAIACWMVTKGWQGLIALAECAVGYLAIFVLNIVAKAVLISRDLAIQRRTNAEGPTLGAR
jgi:hypothetical protein